MAAERTLSRASSATSADVAAECLVVHQDNRHPTGFRVPDARTQYSTELALLPPTGTPVIVITPVWV
jgi:hypothetical protein